MQKIPTSRATLEFASEDVLDELLLGRIPAGARALHPAWLDGDKRGILNIFRERQRAGACLRGWGMWLVVERASGLVVGDVGFKGACDDEGAVEIGYSLVPPSRGSGLGAEVVEAVLDWAFAHPFVRLVRAHVAPENAPSLRIVEKLGFAPRAHEGDEILLELSRFASFSRRGWLQCTSGRSVESILSLYDSLSAPLGVVLHAMAVADGVVRALPFLRARGHSCDGGLSVRAALAHDIGRCRGHGTDHGVVGAEICREKGWLAEASVVERHVGAGIPAWEAKSLGLGGRDLVPRLMEEKLVCSVDNLAKNRVLVSRAELLAEWEEKAVTWKLRPEIVGEVMALHDEMGCLAGASFDKVIQPPRQR